MPEQNPQQNGFGLPGGSPPPAGFSQNTPLPPAPGLYGPPGGFPAAPVRPAGPPPFGKACSRVGLAFVLLMFCFVAGQLAVSELLGRFWPAVLYSPAGLWLCTDLPLYGIGAPLCWLALRGLLKRLPAPARPARYARMTPGWALRAFCLGELLMMGGNFISMGINALLDAALGVQSENAVVEVLEASSIWASLLFVVLVAAVGEELLFRELLFHALAPYGERPYILLSAALFSLFHGNLGQIPYAFLVGLLLAWLRCRTGRPQWGMLLHGTLNLCGGVLPFLILDHPVLTEIWGALILAACVLGCVYLARLRRPRWLRAAAPRPMPACGPLPRHPVRAALLNFGMLAALALSVLIVCITVLADAGITL